MRIEPGNIYQGDCLELMKDMPDGSVDLTVTSPPYDNLRDYNGYIFDFEGIANELFRVTKDGGVVVWVVGDATIKGSETGTSFRQALYFKQIGFNLHDTMIYEKAGSSYPDHTRYYNTFEYMFIFSKGKPRVFSPINDRKNKWWGQKWSNIRSRRDKRGELKVTTWNKPEGDEYGTRFNVWRYAVGYGNSGPKNMDKSHPAIFPEQLAIDHIVSWSNKNDLVLDPMCGSGTVPVACIRTNRRYIGMELSAEYVDIVRQRIKYELMQTRLDI